MRTAAKMIELAVLFVVFPLLYWADWVPVQKVVPLLLLFAYCAYVSWRGGVFQKEQFHLRAPWLQLGLRFVAIAGIALLFVRFYLRLPLFADLDAQPRLVAMLVMYPLLSAFPQEVIFRGFFFHRYRDLFPHRGALLVVNVVLFAFAHVYFANTVVLVFTLVGGFLFAHTYFRTRSLVVVTIEHTAYGLLILSSGLWQYFYKAFS